MDLTTASTSSPDPITLASSPRIVPRNSRSPSKQPSPSRRSPSRKQPTPNTQQHFFSSPSKSVILESARPGEVSPWRIKVTVQAEPNDRPTTMSPSQQKASRASTKIPLKGTGSSSPVKNAPRQGTPHQVTKPTRKRKGTPMRERPSKRPSPEPQSEEDDQTHFSLQSPARRNQSSKKSRRQSLQKMPSPPNKRLSDARDQLENALQEAVGYESEGGEQAINEDAGDLTVSMNEDFTMVSIESLQSYKPNRGEGDKSYASVSYLPSSPPQTKTPGRVEYPDLSSAVKPQTKSSAAKPQMQSPAVKEQTKSPVVKEQAKHPAAAYDAMSWKATDPSKVVSAEDEQAKRIEALMSWRRERESASREREDVQVGAQHRNRSTKTGQTKLHQVQEPEPEVEKPEAEDEDIWQEEASRSMEEQEISQSANPPRSPHLDDLFDDQPVKPPRAKIPRTWRRTSGNDFTYSDSPAHVDHQSRKRTPSAERKNQSRNSSTGSNSARSGVLTPPSTDEDVGKAVVEEDVDTSDLTEPDAAATMLQTRESPAKTTAALIQPAITRPVDRSESQVGNDTTGFVWQAKSRPQWRPERPRAPNQKAMDLSELLNLQSSPAKAKTPLKPAGLGPEHRLFANVSKQDSSTLEQTNSTNGESFESQASDQRQLLSEVRSASKKKSVISEDLHSSGLMSEYDSYFTEVEETPHSKIAQSYEENLNIESPQKILVKFNDSAGNSSLLPPKSQAISLFGNKPTSILHEPGTIPKTPIATKTKPLAPPTNFLTRLTTSIFSALTPSGPTSIHPPTHPTTLVPATFVTKIRSRYGVLPSTHPWTYAHYRTLLRMFNSCTSGASDSIIPRPEEANVVLSDRWRKLMGTVQATLQGEEYVFGEQHALVIVAFFQTLVPGHVVRAMEKGEVDFLGDDNAYSHRGTDRRGNRGGDFVFRKRSAWFLETLPEDGEDVEAEFVLRILGDLVLQEERRPNKVLEEEWKRNPVRMFWGPGEEVEGDAQEEEEEEEGEVEDEEMTEETEESE